MRCFPPFHTFCTKAKMKILIHNGVSVATRDVQWKTYKQKPSVTRIYDDYYCSYACFLCTLFSYLCQCPSTASPSLARSVSNSYWLLATTYINSGDYGLESEWVGVETNCIQRNINTISKSMWEIVVNSFQSLIVGFILISFCVCLLFSDSLSLRCADCVCAICWFVLKMNP